MREGGPGWGVGFAEAAQQATVEILQGYVCDFAPLAGNRTLGIGEMVNLGRGADRGWVEKPSPDPMSGRWGKQREERTDKEILDKGRGAEWRGNGEAGTGGASGLFYFEACRGGFGGKYLHDAGAWAYVD